MTETHQSLCLMCFWAWDFSLFLERSYVAMIKNHQKCERWRAFQRGFLTRLLCDTSNQNRSIARIINFRAITAIIAISTSSLPWPLRRRLALRRRSLPTRRSIGRRPRRPPAPASRPRPRCRPDGPPMGRVRLRNRRRARTRIRRGADRPIQMLMEM